jgi:hypothetical protein
MVSSVGFCFAITSQNLPLHNMNQSSLYGMIATDLMRFVRRDRVTVMLSVYRMCARRFDFNTYLEKSNR